MKTTIVFSLCLLLTLTGLAQRNIISLNGIWDVEESIEATKMPKKFSHQVEVPGMINQSKPAFDDIDDFYSKEYCTNPIVRPGMKKVPISIDSMKVGYNFQKRNYFWYQRTLQIDENKEVYVLKINKAQFGTMVWVNGKKVGESFDCFASQEYDVTKFLQVPGKNTIVIRVGAHPGVIPEYITAGNDYEKKKWTSGMYDDVSLIACNYPYIETVQVAPDIHKKEIMVQTTIISKPGQEKLDLKYDLKEWKSGKAVSTMNYSTVVSSSKPTIITQNVPIPGMKLWSPKSPFLYTVSVSTGGDNTNTRFGMREFRFDTPTKRAYLNDSIIFLRGSNIGLHRFFDDSLCKSHPWEEQWVRKLLTDLPKKYNWNCFRNSIGPLPDKWFDIADEAGLLIQNEYPIWVWSYTPKWDFKIMEEHVKSWMRDSWNHPSMAWWDICNETHSDLLNGVIKNVRSLDLSNRAWDNGFNLPEGSNDPEEDHNYKWYAPFPGMTELWSLQKFETSTGGKESTYGPHPSAHASVLNEYGFLWLNRKGNPTPATRGIYDSIAKGYSAGQFQDLYAYILGAETEFFRAHRNYAGVLHFVYLTSDFYGSLTGDLFKNVETLEPWKVYDDYFSEVFKPLGVYVNYFPKEVLPSAKVKISTMLVNDEYQTLTGNINMQLINIEEKVIAESSCPFKIDALGQQTYKLQFQFPALKGDYWLKTFAIQENGDKTLCRRKIIIR